jgi:hypothetical protein
MSWAVLGRICLISGAVLIALGLLFLLLGRFNFSGLPGDIFVKRENFSFYFPIVTCIVISLVLTLLINLFRR